MKRINVRATFITEALGTCAADPEIHATYIASLAPDAPSKEEEVAAIGVEESVEKAMTVFPRDENGVPFIWDYQIRGHFKASASALARCKGEDFSKETCKLKAYKKIVDTNIFVEPRKIKIDMHGGEVGDCQRPLRADTAQGPRVTLAHSETVPAGSTIEYTIICLSDAHVPAVLEWLEYGYFHGLLQWRGGGKGRFYYELLDEEGNVIGGNMPENFEIAI